MRLRKFRIRAFRCIHDSGEIKVGDLAAFIGRNESGKTTILEALTLFNKGSKVSELDLCDEMTDELKSELRLAEGDFELSDKEIKLIHERFPNLQDIKTIKIYQDIDNIYDNLLVGTSERSALENFIEDKLHPRFVYFSDYKKILGNIDLNEFLKETKGIRPKGLEYIEEFDKAETVKNLFYLAELDVNKLEEVANTPSRLIKLLHTTSRKLSERLNPAWKGDPIHVELRYNPGNILSVVISDVHKDGTVTN